MKPLFEQDRVLVRLQQRVLGDKEIAACFLTGSFGRRTEDAYSDLDVTLVFEGEAARQRAWTARQKFAQSVLPYVPSKSFDAAHIRPYFLIALYSNGAKVDFRYETNESIRPNHWDRDIRILKDDPGWLAAYQAESARTPFTQPQLTTAELTAVDERFWVLFMDVYRLLKRGDADRPFTVYLELLYFTLPPLLNVLPRQESARKFLLQARFSQETDQTVGHLAHLVEDYIRARTAVIRRFHLDFEVDERFETAVRQLIRH